jgi:cysteine desulfuration protein SufE
MTGLPANLQSLADMIEMFPDRADRIDALIGLAGQYVHAKGRELSEEHRVPGCESEVFAWADQHEDRTWTFDFAVENPQGISAMAMCTILKQGLDGCSSEQLQTIPEDIVFHFFGKELSMGKSMGLTGIVRMCKHLSRPT